MSIDTRFTFPGPPQKWIGGIQYELVDEKWVATGVHVECITNTPHRGEPEGSRDRHVHDACIPAAKIMAPFVAAARSVTSPRLETNSDKRKEYPLHSGLIRYFPDALAEVARLSFEATKKHHPDEPMHWDRSKSGDELDALCRHLAEAGTMDEDGSLHDVKVAWRALANLQKVLEKERGLPPSPASTNG